MKITLISLSTSWMLFAGALSAHAAVVPATNANPLLVHDFRPLDQAIFTAPLRSGFQSLASELRGQFALLVKQETLSTHRRPNRFKNRRT